MRFAKNATKSFFNDIKVRNKEMPFFILVSFLASFILSRITVHILPQTHFFYKDYHIHHYFFGIVLIAFAGWVSIVWENLLLKRVLAVVFGLGLGMIIDEWGLLLTCGTAGMSCDYYVRASFDALIIVCAMIFATIYFKPFYEAIKSPIRKIVTKK